MVRRSAAGQVGVTLVAVGEEVGRVEYYLNGRKLAETTLLAAEGSQQAQFTEEPAQPQSWWEKFLAWLGIGS